MGRRCVGRPGLVERLGSSRFRGSLNARLAGQRMACRHRANAWWRPYSGGGFVAALHYISHGQSSRHKESSATRFGLDGSSCFISVHSVPGLCPRVGKPPPRYAWRSEEHTSELQSRPHLVCRLLLEKKKNKHSN